MNPKFWQGKKVFLTGHTGFKGGWLSLWLQSLGAQVTGYSLAPSSYPNFFEEVKISKGMTSIIGDICDLTNLKESIQYSKPEFVFHFAAQPLVRYSYQNPVETYATNVMGLVNLFEAVRTTPEIRSVVVITSDKCYENREWVWPYRESDPMGGHDPYSSSKGCAELVAAAYSSSYFNSAENKQHGVGVATARAGNVIGGGDWSKDRLIPDILTAIHNNTPVKIRNPDAVRPWQHVLEPLRGYLMLAESLEKNGQNFSGGWNFGPHLNDCLSVIDISNQLLSISGSTSQVILNTDHSQPYEASLLRLDISKANGNLFWSPKLSIREALELVWSWEQARKCGKDMREVSMTQISNFQNL